MQTYKVKAHVSMIAHAEMYVQAETPEQAMKDAAWRFKFNRAIRRDCVVANSVDESFPFDFEPLEAEPVTPECCTASEWREILASAAHEASSPNTAGQTAAPKTHQPNP